jgi:hypothetical protein
LSDNIYINQNILNSQVVNKAAEIIFKNVKSEIYNESLNTYIIKSILILLNKWK